MDIIRSHANARRTTLWYLLRSRRFSHYKFRRQHPVGHYILDFACGEARLVIELDGGQHDENQEYDRQRTVWLNQKGWHVIRFWNNELRSNEETVLEKILEMLQTLLPSP
ncbi:MAG: DUF559 domain-containing protein [Enterobacter sp.]|jgi:very-short-patch-repair endonuclease|nr:DUF559 domain-containing protein [Enterobacter sp.]